MVFMSLSDIAILNTKNVDYCYSSLLLELAKLKL